MKNALSQTGSFVVEVGSKKAGWDALGKRWARALEESFGPSLRQVRTFHLYRIEGDLSQAERLRIARELLCDPISENYSFGEVPSPLRGRVYAEVWFLGGVTDAVGESVQEALADMGIFSVDRVRTGRRYELCFADRVPPRRKLRSVLSRTLLNPLIQYFSLK
ncbi:MAG: phosphoribosylformylglycinamidine synthase subunit PurS [Elusimicrobia bacterium]|nr:phosphoribosylformylglycinamidine synthase subunit PurS [Elusimicrobiota bacterium]